MLFCVPDSYHKYVSSSGESHPYSSIDMTYVENKRSNGMAKQTSPASPTKKHFWRQINWVYISATLKCERHTGIFLQWKSTRLKIDSSSDDMITCSSLQSSEPDSQEGLPANRAIHSQLSRLMGAIKIPNHH
ncbi:hypothetical protein UY3_14135 [Chelonia mydas]|uniref:Uncharacterized protein n=1 Tax=Chelonia mydas TaxID=8469 RepID=M7AVK5_CHEMY|nr:hypothetical protein UY3_14135 [Chelonia mydas]